MKTLLITGASAGIGKKTAELFLKKGWKVYAAARRTEKMQDLKAKGASIIHLDLMDDNSIKKAIDIACGEGKQLDALVNNAGFGAHGMLEDVPIELARKQFEVNVFGLARMCQLALPTMRKAGSGRIINISSIAGKTYMPTGSWYHASKHAVEALSDCLRIEAAQFGIKVIMIEPGPVGGTEWDDTALVNLKKYSWNSAYAAMTRRLVNKFRGNYREKGLKPETIAAVIYKAATTARPSARYAVPFKTKACLMALRFLPDTLLDFTYKLLFEPSAKEIEEAEKSQG